MRLASFLLVALSITALTSATQAQSLHGQWFKVVASADGYGFNPETEALEKAKVKPITRYMFFIANEGGGPSYTGQSYAPTTDGGWVASYTSDFVMLNNDEDFLSDGYLVLLTEPISVEVDAGAPNVLILEFNATVKSKYKQEALKSSKIKSLGAVAEFFNESFDYFQGKGKCSLTRIDQSKLPFSPPTLAAVQASIANAPVAPRPASQASQHAEQPAAPQQPAQ